MKLYHGTNVEFEFIDIEYCPPHRDFGRGFYTTQIKIHAEQRAQDKVAKEGGTAIVKELEFSETMFDDPALRVKRFAEADEEWALFVMHNRTLPEDAAGHDYDIVEGPVANDKMFKQFNLYKRNQLKLAKFVKSLKHSEPTHQIAFCSERALDILFDYNDDPRTKINDIVVALTIALMEEKGWSDDEAQKTVYNSLVFDKLENQSSGLYLSRWQKIYEMLKQELNGSNNE